MIRRGYIDETGAELIGPAGAARALGVTPAAVSNYAKRGTGPLPAPVASVKGPRGPIPLWTAVQVAAAVETETHTLERRLADVRRRISRLEGTAAGYERRLKLIRG